MTKDKHSQARIGHVYALPIRKDEWAVLLIVAVGKHPRLQGRVATRVWINPPNCLDLSKSLFLNPLLTFIHGDLSIKSGEWLDLGCVSFDSIEDLVQQEFFHKNSNSVYLVNPSTLLCSSQRQLRAGEDTLLPEYYMAGSVYLENWLQRNLDRFM